MDINVRLGRLGLSGDGEEGSYIVMGERMSAGRLYNEITNVVVGIVKYKLSSGVLCEVKNTETYVEE